MRRIVVKTAVVVVLVVVAVGAASAGLVLAMFRHFNTAPPQMTFVKATNNLEAQRQDLAYFRQLMELDRSFTPAARTEAENRIAALESLPTPLDYPHFRVALMKILALADNGHTHLDSGAGAHSRKLPARVAVFADGLYIVRTTRAGLALLGGRLVAIDGKPIEIVMQRMAELRGGTEGWRMLYAAMYLIDQDILFGDDIAADAKHSAWTTVTSGGTQTTVMLNADPARDDEPFIFTKRWISSEPVPSLGDGWYTEQPDHPLPLALREFDTAFRRLRLTNSCAMLIQFKSNNDVEDQHIKAFVAATESDLRSNKPCSVILDLRYDDGGDYRNTVDFARDLPKLTTPGGRILILTGPSTFSAGISTAAFVKQAGGERVTILGEAVGDRLHFFSEGNRGCLPNYKLCVSYERGKHDYSHACADWDVCFWLNKIYPVQVETLEPAESIRMSFADWRLGRDPVFERATSLLSSAGS